MNEHGSYNPREIIEGNLTKGQNHTLNSLIGAATRSGDTELVSQLETIRRSIKDGKTQFVSHEEVIEAASARFAQETELKEFKTSPSIFSRISRFFNPKNSS